MAKEEKKVSRVSTTNYAKDSHREFCKRCFAHHDKKCPVTKSKKFSKSCNL